jgi:hypothetical protein
LLKLPDREKSKCSFGAAENSTSMPRLRAFGTLKMTRDEQEPAVTVACRSSISMSKRATLKAPRPRRIRDLDPTS